MSLIRQCKTCGKNIVEPAFSGDGDYPVEPMCRCKRPSHDPA